MPVTYLKGAGAAIGRGAEAFEAQQGQHADAACSIEAAMQTGRYWPPSVPPVLSILLFYLLGRLFAITIRKVVHCNASVALSNSQGVHKIDKAADSLHASFCIMCQRHMNCLRQQ